MAKAALLLLAVARLHIPDLAAAILIEIIKLRRRRLLALHLPLPHRRRKLVEIELTILVGIGRPVLAFSAASASLSKRRAARRTFQSAIQSSSTSRNIANTLLPTNDDRQQHPLEEGFEDAQADEAVREHILTLRLR